MPNWKNINLPVEMIDEIEKIIDEKPEYGYTSPRDFITSAIRAYVDYRKALEHKERSEQPSQDSNDSPWVTCKLQQEFLS